MLRRVTFSVRVLLLSGFTVVIAVELRGWTLARASGSFGWLVSGLSPCEYLHSAFCIEAAYARCRGQMRVNESKHVIIVLVEIDCTNADRIISIGRMV